jgi:hypothetical protein
MVSRLKFDISNEIDRQFSQFPTYIWQSDSTTFCDLNMAGGQFIEKVGEWLRKYGHSNDSIRKRVFGFSEKSLYLSYIKSNPFLIGTFDVYKENINMKFDVIIGNPPYQEKVGPNKTEPLWNKFVKKAIELCNTNGYVAMIHPSGWRNIEGKFKDIQKLILSKKVYFLSIHNEKDGLETFGAETRYDYYVLQNVENDGSETMVRFQDGQVKNIVTGNSIYTGFGDRNTKL